MTPQLRNTEAGLRTIAKIRIADSKALKLFLDAKLNELERYRKRDKPSPFNLEQRVTKKIQPQLDKQYGEVERIVASRIGTDDPANAPKNFKVGFKSNWERNGLPYIIKIKKGKKIWVPYKLGKEPK